MVLGRRGLYEVKQLGKRGYTLGSRPPLGDRRPVRSHGCWRSAEVIEFEKDGEPFLFAHSAYARGLFTPDKRSEGLVIELQEGLQTKTVWAS